MSMGFETLLRSPEDAAEISDSKKAIEYAMDPFGDDHWPLDQVEQIFSDFTSETSHPVRTVPAIDSARATKKDGLTSKPKIA